MRVQCPWCGERDAGEFAFLGDASCRRPSPDVPDAQSRFFDYAYPRDNPAGRYEELWYHASGCRSWLRVVRDTLTHAVHSVHLLKEAGE